MFHGYFRDFFAKIHNKSWGDPVFWILFALPKVSARYISALGHGFRQIPVVARLEQRRGCVVILTLTAPEPPYFPGLEAFGQRLPCPDLVESPADPGMVIAASRGMAELTSKGSKGVLDGVICLR